MGLLRPDGGRKVIAYRVVTQPWLRELVKQWNRERLVSHSFHTLRASVQFAAALSAVLALRVDRGEDPNALGRQDVVDFLTDLFSREQVGGDLAMPAGAHASHGCGRCCVKLTCAGSAGRLDRPRGCQISSPSVSPTVPVWRRATPKASPSGRCRKW